MNKLKKSAKKVSAVLLAGALLVPGGIFAEGQVKNDYSKHWARETIQQWIDLGFIKGVGGNQGVVPDRHVTRAEFVRMTNMRYDFKESSESGKFSDVKKGNWFYDDIMIALQKGYIAGVTANSFAPNQTITREQAGTIVARIAKVEDNEARVNVFKDANKISPYAKPPVGGAVEKQIISGYQDNTFRPKNPLTRAEAIVLIQRAFDRSQIVPTQEFTVTFDSNGGSAVKSQVVQRGQKVKKPENPTKVNAEFLGWYLGDEKFDFDTVINKNITLVAKWGQPGTSSSSDGGSSSSSTIIILTSKDQLIDDMAAKAFVGQDKVQFGIQRHVDGVLTENFPKFDLNVSVAQNIHDNLDKVAGSMDKAQKKLNNNASKAYKVFYKDGSGVYQPYLTSGRFDEKIIAPLDVLGKATLKARMEGVKGKLTFDGSGVLTGVSSQFVKDLLNDFTDEAVVNEIADMDLAKLQEIVRGFEKPFHSSDGTNNASTMKDIRYLLVLKINGDTYTINSESSEEEQERDRMVAAIHNLSKVMKGTTRQALAQVFELSFRTEVESKHKTPGNPNSYMPKERKIVIGPIATLSDETVTSAAFSPMKARLESNTILTPMMKDGKKVWNLNLAKLQLNKEIFTEEELKQLSNLIAK